MNGPGVDSSHEAERIVKSHGSKEFRCLQGAHAVVAVDNFFSLVRTIPTCRLLCELRKWNEFGSVDVAILPFFFLPTVNNLEGFRLSLEKAHQVSDTDLHLIFEHGSINNPQ